MGEVEGWKQVLTQVKIVTLTPLVMAAVPSLALAALPKRTRGFSFYPGRTGVAVGASLLVGSAAIGVLVLGTLGPLGAAASFWLLGTTGVVMVANGARPMAFVKPICTRCRLLPIVKEHESIHLAGVPGEDAVWASMRTRHSVESLALEGDPAICSFCPIPKRLARK